MPFWNGDTYGIEYPNCMDTGHYVLMDISLVVFAVYAGNLANRGMCQDKVERELVIIDQIGNDDITNEEETVRVYLEMIALEE
ncbi:hypothetical protein DSO57_1030907 [Entomophthora muscae]|uniref:Uncharacterized protein n=1 Tax=Entomophthora muscae TaxID=34485 RepID=A0ACC2S2W1_9FUNG|nr:hypothetical protein DSO57_1030907 [Entomophthora muscae]